ncbi:MAG: hypothetical protein FWC41_12875 [Firmicutes bacterium]|nr:hypothetical protein [Bacillota bacterium]
MDGNLTLNRFNLTRYSMPETPIIERNFSRTINMNFMAVAGGRLYLDFSRNMNTNFTGRTDMHAVIIFKRNLNISFNSQVEMNMYMNALRNINNKFFGNAYAGKKINFSRNIESELKSNIHVGKIIPLMRNSQTRFEACAHAGKYINFDKNIQSIFTSFVAMGLSRHAVAIINVDLNPGEEIRIDSDIFTAMKGDKNILHLYNGDWVYINRNTVILQTEAGSGGDLDIELVYVTRYL